MTSTRPRRDGRRLALLALSAAVLVTVVAGCGQSAGYSEGTGDRANGKELFVSKCGGCHTLADAGTTGQVGPDLDNAFATSRKDGLGESTIVQVVRGQIEYPVTDPSTGAPGMPANIVEGQEAEDVASYVAAVAGLPVTTPTPAPTPQPEPAPAPGGSAGEAAAGKAVFQSAGCGSCHTLADAGSTGAVGPNLDDAHPDAALVTDRVTNGKGVMPPFKGQLDETQIADVAAYVSSVAGK